MTIETHRLNVSTKGHCHVVDLSALVEAALRKGTIRNGLATAFVVGSTAAVSTTEFEPGLVQQDLRAAYDRIAPEDADYLHEATWHDDNGHSHVRATITGPSITVPLVEGRLTLGTWQQIVLLEFDTRPRQREVIVQILGE
jgi:secondary thiamine-phosphate synthase enzyme